MQDGAIGIFAHLMDRADVAAFGDNGSVVNLHTLNSGRLASSLDFGLSPRMGGVFVARQNRTAFVLRSVGRADLHKLRFRSNGLCYMRCEFCLVAFWVNLHWSSCFPRSSPNRSLLCPACLEQSAQLTAVRTSCASRLSKGASFKTSSTLVSIQNCRLRTGKRIRAGFSEPL
jgi:hypothetical protein